MAEKLFAGYAAFTTADEFGATAAGESPASLTVITVWTVRLAC